MMFSKGEHMPPPQASRSSARAFLLSATLCPSGQFCVVGSTGPSCRCVASAYRACSTGDVWNFNSCNTRNTIAESCTGATECTEGPLGPYCGPRVTCLSDDL